MRARPWGENDKLYVFHFDFEIIPPAAPSIGVSGWRRGEYAG